MRLPEDLFSLARWSSRVPLVMTVRASAYACTYSRASLGRYFWPKNWKIFIEPLLLVVSHGKMMVHTPTVVGSF